MCVYVFTRAYGHENTRVLLKKITFVNCPSLKLGNNISFLNCKDFQFLFSMGDGITYPTRTVDLDSDHLLGERQRWMEEGEANGTAGIC